MIKHSNPMTKRKKTIKPAIIFMTKLSFCHEYKRFHPRIDTIYTKKLYNNLTISIAWDN